MSEGNIMNKGNRVRANPLNLEKLTDEVMKVIERSEAKREEIREQIRRVLKKHLKELSEFCLRYRGHPDLLVEEHPEYKKEAVKYWSMALQYDVMCLYDTWLLQIAFRDVEK